MLSTTFLRDSKTPIVTLIFICAVVLGIGAALKRGNGPGKQDGTTRIQSITPRVKNSTRSFALTQAREDRGVDEARPELSLRNEYDKNITACAVSVNGLISIIDFVYSEGKDQVGIAPEAVYTRRFSYARSVNPADASRLDLDINVLAVVFDDRSSDGDPKVVEGIFVERKKSKRRLASIVDLLNEHLDSRRSSDDTGFDELRARISSIPSDAQSSNEKEDVLRWLGQLDRTLSPRERTKRLKKPARILLLGCDFHCLVRT